MVPNGILAHGNAFARIKSKNMDKTTKPLRLTTQQIRCFKDYPFVLFLFLGERWEVKIGLDLDELLFIYDAVLKSSAPWALYRNINA